MEGWLRFSKKRGEGIRTLFESCSSLNHAVLERSYCGTVLRWELTVEDAVRPDVGPRGYPAERPLVHVLTEAVWLHAHLLFLYIAE